MMNMLEKTIVANDPSEPARSGVGRLKESGDCFERGKMFTLDLLKENERLRLLLSQSENDKIKIISRSDLKTRQLLEDENQRLMDRVEQLEASLKRIERENRELSLQYVEALEVSSKLAAIIFEKAPLFTRAEGSGLHGEKLKGSLIMDSSNQSDP